MPETRELSEVYNRRLSKTRDAELRWLLQTLGNELERMTKANRIAYWAINEISDEWKTLGILKEEESG